MALKKIRERQFWKLMLVGVLTCFFFIMLSVVIYREKQIDYSWLKFLDDETPEDKCNCRKIIQGDIKEIEDAKLLAITKTFKNQTRIADEHYTELAKDCERFRMTRKYIPFTLSEEEEAFPLAYSIVVHHKVQNFERLLRSIYAPQNFYCVHVDTKSPESTRTAISAIVSCFDNVFIASKLENVVYASWSRVQADINCMKDLYQISDRWKYFINLCGQDFPMKTNLEMVHALKELRGGNSLETETMPSHKEFRWKKRHIVKDGGIHNTNEDKEPPPSGIKVLSGGAYIVVSRAFIRFVLEDPKAQELILWSNDTYSPDEILWATMQRMPGVPGYIRSHSKYDRTDMNSISRLIKWEDHEGAYDAVYPPCQGIHIRAICVYGVGDLQWMLEQSHLFANKFDTDFDPIAMRCLEKYLRNKTLKTQVRGLTAIKHFHETPLQHLESTSYLNLSLTNEGTGHTWP